MKRWKYRRATDFGLPPTQRLRSLQRESGLIATASHYCMGNLIRGYLTLYHRLSIQGRENLPRRPRFILVANHASHLDTLVLAAALPWRFRSRAFPIAAGDNFFETPAQALFSTLVLNALPMWRRHCGRHALDDLRRRITEEHCIYILFPEGTRTRDGKMGSFKPGVGMIMAGTRVPIVPCFLSGTFAALPPHVHCPRASRIRVTIGQPLYFDDIPRRRSGWNYIAETLQEAVINLGGSSDSQESDNG